MTITTEHSSVLRSPQDGPLFQPGRIGRLTLPSMTAVGLSALVASAVVGASMTLAAPAAATPSRGVESTVIWEKTEGGKDRILFANPHNLDRADGKGKPGTSRDRKNLSIKLSYD